MNKTRSFAEAQRLVPALLRQRDEAWLAPLPWRAGDPRNDAYVAAMRELSAALDELAAASAADDAARSTALLDRLVALINQPYGLAL